MLLLELLGNLGSDSVHVGHALLGESLADALLAAVVVLEGELANQASSLQLLEAVSDALASRLAGVLGHRAVSLVGRVVLAEGVDSHLASHVQLVRHRGCSRVQPVVIIGGQLLGARSLDVNGPLFN